MTIASKNYIATVADVEKIAAAIIDGDIQVATSRGTYLKVLVASTQDELKSPPRQRSGKAPKLDAPGIAEHLVAFQSVADKFYAACMRVAQNTVPAPDTAMIRSRTTFARSAASTVRGYIRAGNDIRALAAARTTKASLATPRKRRKASVAAMQKRAEKLAGELTAVCKSLEAADHGAAVQTMTPVIQQLTAVTGVSEPTGRVVRVARHKTAENRVQ